MPSSAWARGYAATRDGGGDTIPTRAYYATYHGHSEHYLGMACEKLRRRHRSMVFLAGDSSLDNKYWFHDRVEAINGYEEILSPPTMKPDVCYWINHELMQRGAADMCCLNTAIEATALNDRPFCHLLEQDRFITNNIAQQDYLVVSIGGNDIALKPVLATILNMLLLVYCTPRACLERCACGMPPNLWLDDGCLCCGAPGCVTGLLCGWPPGMGYFINMYKNSIENYVRKLLGGTRPKKVLVCMIYYPDELATGGWADGALSCLCYDSNPGRLQALIRVVFEQATCRIRIPGTEVVPVPLFEVLDGRTTGDYIARVEPSVEGGRKMAAAIVSAILAGSATSAADSDDTSSPEQQRMC